MPAPSTPVRLDGLVALALSSVGPSARCARILADYGATVIEVLAPPHRRGVQIEPPFHAYGAHRAMKRVLLDLKPPAGRTALLRLAAAADVIIESYRPGVAARLGIGYDDVRRVNPSLIYCSTSGYGQDGPYATWAGHDLDYLAVGGYLACSGPRADGGPPLPGATVADAAGGGMHAAIAILAALVQRATTGAGAHLDVSVVEGVLYLTSLWIDEHLASGARPGPGHDLLTGRYACYDVYRARDGRWLAVAAIEPPFWANLCRALGVEEWIPHQTDDARQDAVRAALRAAFATRDRDEWVAVLAPADTCVAPVLSIAELAADPHLAARRVFVEAARPTQERFAQVGPLLAGADRGRRRWELPHPSATDTEEVLRGAGFAAAEIDEMRRQGVVA
jgi:alpha-methylacyl-CoA racemase